MRLLDWLAGAGGLEPPNGGIKIRCLTTWLRPIGLPPRRADHSGAFSPDQRSPAPRCDMRRPRPRRPIDFRFPAAARPKLRQGLESALAGGRPPDSGSGTARRAHFPPLRPDVRLSPNSGAKADIVRLPSWATFRHHSEMAMVRFGAEHASPSEVWLSPNARDEPASDPRGVIRIARKL